MENKSVMSQKKSSAIGSKKEVTPKENRAWVVTMISSKWFFILIFLLAGIIWFSFYTTHTKEIPGSDDREYASIAKNIVTGRGIVRNFIYPSDINFFQKLPVPEFVHPPGYPLILAGFFNLFGVSDFVALLPSYVSYFILVTVFFYFVKRNLDMKTAVTTALILIFSKDILDFSLVALSEMVYTLIFFLFFIMTIKARTFKDIFISGILLGVSHLIRENIYPYLLPLIIYLYFYPHLPRYKKMVYFILGILIPIIPNMVRSFLETGSPFFSYGKFALMTFTDKYPWMNVYRGIEIPAFELGQFIVKYSNNLVGAVEGILSISNPYLLAFFFVEMFHWVSNGLWKKAKILFLLLFVSQIFFTPLISFNSRYFIPFIPIIILFGSKSFLRICGDLLSAVKVRWEKTIYLLILLLFLVFFVMPSTYLVLKQGGPPMLNFKTPQFGFLIPTGEAKRLNDFLRSELNEDQVVWTDIPEVLEWEGNRLCGWLPIKIEHLYEIRKKIPVDAILLTNLRTPTRMEQGWKYLLYSEASLPLYRTVKIYQGKGIFAKLLIRDDRE